MGIDPDDPLAPPPPKMRPLDSLSLHELEERKASLLAEIARIDAMIASKQDHRTAADALFKS